ncbi:hypothetical protein Dsin_015032 [Dipteronia sinensis]|uniref:Uncharacterized protein n=1 Tax=Dipteronia sinensis TaxID=43782 RepID=A0AAE0EAW3_9ROSI|nr:hypothetical protein Dsin_015032 [Dipteronia sinensis]
MASKKCLIACVILLLFVLLLISQVSLTTRLIGKTPVAVVGSKAPPAKGP